MFMGRATTPNSSSRTRGREATAKAFRRLGLPKDEVNLLDALFRALDEDTLIDFDKLEGQEQERLDFTFATPERALWLGAGLRLPMLRDQITWIVDRLASHTCLTKVLDIGSGPGLTSAVIAASLNVPVTALDPQRGSAASAARLATELQCIVSSCDTSPSDAPVQVWEETGAIICQAVMWYLQPGLEPGGTVADGINEGAAISDVSDDARTVFKHAGDCGLLLVCDHAFPNLWSFTIQQAKVVGLRPDWESLIDVSHDLPLGFDRQLCLKFVAGPSDGDDLETLRQVLA